MLVIFRNTILVERLEELDTKLKYNEIDEPVYQLRYQDCKDALMSVFKEGNKLFKAVKDINFEDTGIPVSVKNRALNGLMSFVETCERLQRHKSGENFAYISSSILASYMQNNS